jgi:hypothetical protein
MSSESIASSTSSSSLVIGLAGKWFYSNGLGTYYQITDIDGLNVFYMGTICQDSDSNKNSGGKCDINLNPGCYIFRVDGAFDPDIEQISWDFCGARGGAQTQLNFCVDDNLQCKATSVETAEELCADTVTDSPSQSVSMSGTFQLGGMREPEITDTDKEAIRHALIKDISDASNRPRKERHVKIHKMSWDRIHFQDTNSHGKRNLENSGFTTIVSFEVNLPTDIFGVKTIDEAGLTKLHHHMNNYLSRSMSAGIFAKKLIDAAKSVQANNLESINFAKLVTIKAINNNVSAINNNFSIIANLIIIGSVMIGIVFSYMTYRIMTQQFNDYGAVISLSQHKMVVIDTNTSIELKNNNICVY